MPQHPERTSHSQLSLTRCPLRSAASQVVNTYGVPRYREANPALFTAVTFPFLFAIMYGDIGHALLLSIFSAIMVIREGPLSRANLNEVVSMAFGGRYMLLLMVRLTGCGQCHLSALSHAAPFTIVFTGHL